MILRTNPINIIANIGEKSIVLIPNKFCCNLLKGSSIGKLKDCNKLYAVPNLRLGIYDNITSNKIVVSKTRLNRFTNITIMFIINSPLFVPVK